MQSNPLAAGLITFVLACALLATLWKLHHPRLRRLWRQQLKPRLPRRWKPQSPDDCPHCRAGQSWNANLSFARLPLTPNVKVLAARRKPSPLKALPVPILTAATLLSPTK